MKLRSLLASVVLVAFASGLNAQDEGVRLPPTRPADAQKVLGTTPEQGSPAAPQAEKPAAKPAPKKGKKAHAKKHTKKKRKTHSESPAQ